jgi:hypothetical protein
VFMSLSSAWVSRGLSVSVCMMCCANGLCLTATGLLGTASCPAREVSFGNTDLPPCAYRVPHSSAGFAIRLVPVLVHRPWCLYVHCPLLSNWFLELGLISW